MSSIPKTHPQSSNVAGWSDAAAAFNQYLAQGVDRSWLAICWTIIQH